MGTCMYSDRSHHIMTIVNANMIWLFRYALAPVDEFVSTENVFIRIRKIV